MTKVIQANIGHMSEIEKLLVARDGTDQNSSIIIIEESIKSGLCWLLLDESQRVVGICNGIYDILKFSTQDVKIFYWMNLFILDNARNVFGFLQLKKYMKNKLKTDNCDLILAFVHRHKICSLHEKTGMQVIGKRYLKITIPLFHLKKTIDGRRLKSVYDLKLKNANAFNVKKDLRKYSFKSLPILCIQRINATIPFMIKLLPMLYLSKSSFGLVVKKYVIFGEALNKSINLNLCNDIIIECGDHDAL